VLKERAVDVLFLSAGGRIYLSTIDTGFLDGPWDIDLEDKQFSKNIVLPKHSRVKEVCAIVFHVGEPERAATQAPCRSPL
jgi:hypothetical protein